MGKAGSILPSAIAGVLLLSGAGAVDWAAAAGSKSPGRTAKGVTDRVKLDNRLPGKSKRTLSKSPAFAERPFIVDSSAGHTVPRNSASPRHVFHSFEALDLAKGSQLWFTGPESLQNVVARVTGGASAIDGKLAVRLGPDPSIRDNPANRANLYLINPNGIVFGENASLDVRGAVVISTAERLTIAGERADTALDQQPGVELRVADSTSFGFGPRPRGVTFEPRADSSKVFAVDPGQTMSVVAGDILVDRAKLRAARGRVNLVSVASAGVVEMDATSPTAPPAELTGFERGGDIIVRSVNTRDKDADGNFTDPLRADASVAAGGLDGDGNDTNNVGGRIVIRGGALTVEAPLPAEKFRNEDRIEVVPQALRDRLNKSAFITTANDGGVPSDDLRQRNGGIDIHVGGPITLSSGRIETFTNNEADAGDIHIRARSMDVLDGGRVDARADLAAGSRRVGHAGHIDIHLAGGALRVENTRPVRGSAGGQQVLTPEGLADSISTIRTRVRDGNPQSTARSGDVTVTAETIHVGLLGNIDARSSTSDAGVVRLTGRAGVSVGNPTGPVRFYEFTRGPGGALDGIARPVALEDEGRRTLTGLGRLDDLLLNENVNELDRLQGGGGRVPTAAVLAQRERGMGTGEIRIDAPGGTLNLTPGAKIEGPKITLSADAITLTGPDTEVTGQPGSASVIDLLAGRLTIEMNAQVKNLAADNRPGGAINVSGLRRGERARTVELRTGGQIVTTAPRTSTAPGGNINIQADVLRVHDEFAVVNTVVVGGRIRDDIDPTDLSAVTLLNTGRDSAIKASTNAVGKADSAKARGGNLTIRAGQIEVGPVAVISVNAIDEANRPAPVAPAGKLTIDAGGLLVQGHLGRIQAETTGTGAGGDIDIRAGDVRLLNGGQISSSSAPAGPGRPDSLPLGAVAGSAGDLTLSAENLFISGYSPIKPAPDLGQFPTVEARQAARREAQKFQAGIIATATPAASGASGGNITLQVVNAFEVFDGQVISSGTLNGGNILIDPMRVLVGPGGRIQADAVGLNAGNVDIIISPGGAFLLSPFGRISARSAAGPQFNGVIRITSPDKNFAGELITLEGEVRPVTATLFDCCELKLSRDLSSFTQKPAEALPLSPAGWIPLQP